MHSIPIKSPTNSPPTLSPPSHSPPIPIVPPSQFLDLQVWLSSGPHRSYPVSPTQPAIQPPGWRHLKPPLGSRQGRMVRTISQSSVDTGPWLEHLIHNPGCRSNNWRNKNDKFLFGSSLSACCQVFQLSEMSVQHRPQYQHGNNFLERRKEWNWICIWFKRSAYCLDASLLREN